MTTATTVGEDHRVSLTIFSGGTASNSFCRELLKLTEDVSYILPISDDGGSTAEIVRVLGGPAIGDIRSRLVRLSDGSTEESKAVLRLLQYRLQPFTTVNPPHHKGGHHDGRDVHLPHHAASLEWLHILDGTHRSAQWSSCLCLAPSTLNPPPFSTLSP